MADTLFLKKNDFTFFVNYSYSDKSSSSFEIFNESDLRVVFTNGKDKIICTYSFTDNGLELKLSSLKAKIKSVLIGVKNDECEFKYFDYNNNELSNVPQIVKSMLNDFTRVYIGISKYLQDENRERIERNVMKRDSNNSVYKSNHKKLKVLSSVVIKYTNEHGNGTRHSYEYGVRGFMRHYKNGKTVWIEPYVRCKGRGEKKYHEYVM